MTSVALNMLKVNDALYDDDIDILPSPQPIDEEVFEQCGEENASPEDVDER